MPIYEFRCENCNKTKELLIMPSDTENTDIPICCNQLMIRTIGAINFKIKGHSAKNGYSRKPSLVDNAPE